MTGQLGVMLKSVNGLAIQNRNGNLHIVQDLSRTPTFETWTQTSNRPGLEMVLKRSVTGLRHSLQWSVTGL